MENNAMVGTETRSVSERVWAVAETAGAERRKKIEKTVDRVLGIFDGAGELAKIGSEAVKAKANEIKDKANDLKERTEQKISDTKEKLVNRYESARDNLISRVEAFKKGVTDKATELKNRAVKAGLTAGLGIEDRVAKVMELPAELREKRAGKLEAKAAGIEKTKEATMAEQFAEKHGLNEMQQEALKEFLAMQAEEKGMLEGEHENVRAEMDKSIKAAKEKSVELKKKAVETRSSVEKKRVFKALVAKLGS